MQGGPGNGVPPRPPNPPCRSYSVGDETFTSASPRRSLAGETEGSSSPVMMCNDRVVLTERQRQYLLDHRNSLASIEGSKLADDFGHSLEFEECNNRRTSQAKSAWDYTEHSVAIRPLPLLPIQCHHWVSCAALLLVVALLQASNILISHFTSLDETGTYYFATVGALGVLGAVSAGIAFLAHNHALHQARLVTIVTLAVASFLPPRATDVAKVAHMQSIILMCVLPIADEISIAVGSVLCVIAWMLTSVVDHRLAFSTAYPSFLLLGSAFIAAFVIIRVRNKDNLEWESVVVTLEGKPLPGGEESSAGTEEEKPVQDPGHPPAPLRSNSPTRSEDTLKYNQEIISTASQALRQPKKQQSSADGAFYIASAETINSRLTCVRSSVDGPRSDEIPFHSQDSRRRLSSISGGVGLEETLVRRRPSLVGEEKRRSLSADDKSPLPQRRLSDGGEKVTSVRRLSGEEKGRLIHRRNSTMQEPAALLLPSDEITTAPSSPVDNPRLPQRTQSLCSHASMHSDKSAVSSAAGSYVSFVATLKRTEGAAVSFGYVQKRESGMFNDDEQDELEDDPELLDESSETDDILTGELRQHMTPASSFSKRPGGKMVRGREVVKSPDMKLHRRFSMSGMHPRHPRPAHVNSILPPSTPSTTGSRTLAPPPTPPLASQSSLSVIKSAEQTRKDTDETRELVKSVVQLDFNHKPESSGEMQAPFQNLPMPTLQKLVVLFSRLAEELETFRVQQFIIHCVCQVMQCDRAAIFLAEWKRKEIWTISDEGHEIRVPMDGSLAGYAALHNRVLNIKDAYSDSRFNKEVDKNTGYVTRNLLVYPISRGFGYTPNRGEGGDEANVVAVIEAINKFHGSFTAEDENVLALLGKQAGIHLSNAQIYQQLQIEGNKTQTLLEVSKEISDVQLDLGAMMARIMARARQVLTVERASIFLVDDQKQELWSILTDSETAAQLGGDYVIRFPVGVGLAGHVAVTGNILNIPDAYSCELFNPEFDRKTGFVTKSTLCVPVKPQHASKVMGVIQFINKCNGDAFHEEDEELALSFSSFVGISLNNILLYEELREGQLIREKNKELLRLRDEAKQAAEAKSNFLMAMSHEIRTPMSGVIGMCELLMNTGLSSEQREMADTIRSCGEALMAIINDVLDYGRLDAGKLELEQREFELPSLLEETIDVVRSKTEAKGITLMLDMAIDIPTKAIGDSYRLRQVLTNLLGNAVKFTPDGGDITLTVRNHDPPRDASTDPSKLYVYFSVADTGIGIAKAAQVRLFKPFEQADAGTTRQYGGSGLGLAICKQLVDAMDGTIGITSEVNHGSTFWFTSTFKAPDEWQPLSQLMRQMAPKDLNDVSVVVACSHPKFRRIIQQLCSPLRVKLGCLDSMPQLTELVDNLPTVPKKTSEGIPSIIMIDESLQGLESEGLANVLQRVKACRGGNINASPRVAIMMTMKSKSAAGSNKDYAAILTKPLKIGPLMRLLSSGHPCFSEESVAAELSPVQKEMYAPSDFEAKLLVAEDIPTNQLLIKKQLKGFGIVPTMCENGQEAVDKLLSEYHDLVLMDCHMPVLDGYGASRKIRELEKAGQISQGRRPVTIVALTADALPHTRGLCEEAGMDDYMTKPLRKNMLKAVLDKYYFKTAK